MKKIGFLLILFITIIFLSLNNMPRVRFMGYLSKDEKVEISYIFGLKTVTFSFDELKKDKLSWDDNFTFFSDEIKIPWFFNRQRFKLKHYTNNECVFDSTYNQKSIYPFYLIGVLNPTIYQKMLSNGDDVSNYRFYFKTRQDDIELENEIRKIQDIEKKSRTDSLNYSH